MSLFLAFLLIPIIEIGLFIQVGGIIGLFPTLAIVILTAVLGSWLVRTQGMLAMGQLRNSFERLSDPTEPLARGAMILLSGALLVTPGFFTDSLGFLLLVPAIRTRVFSYMRSRVTVASFQMGAGAHRTGNQPPFQQDDIIDGEFEEVKPRSKKQGPSDWVEGPK